MSRLYPRRQVIWSQTQRTNGTDHLATESFDETNGWKMKRSTGKLKQNIPQNPSWTVPAEAMRKTAKPACGVEDKRSKTSQWMIGHEEQRESYIFVIQRLVGLRNRATEQRNEEKRTEIVEATKKTVESKTRSWKSGTTYDGATLSISAKKRQERRIWEKCMQSWNR